MGTVYLAHDTQLDRPVALKVPNLSAKDGPLVVERFFREARAAATLNHPNLCPVYDVGEAGGIYYLTMAYIDGKSLSDVMQARKEPFPQRYAAVLIYKLATAMAEAHRNHVIHRDLKPANVLIDRRNQPIITDFGIARRGNTGDARLTNAGAIMGTPAYMAPEQAQGDLDRCGPASDVYSLGVMLYELLAGRPPFTGDAMAVLSRLLLEEPDPPSKYRADIDSELQAICLKAMAKRVEARYRTMDALAAALTAYIKSTGEGEKPSGSREMVAVPAAFEVVEDEPRRTGLVAGIAAAVVVAVIVCGYVVYSMLPQSPTPVQSREVAVEVKPTIRPAEPVPLPGSPKPEAVSSQLPLPLPDPPKPPPLPEVVRPKATPPAPAAAPEFQFHIVPVVKGLTVSRTPTQQDELIALGRRSGVDLRNPIHPLLAYGYRDNRLFYLLYNTIDTRSAPRAYIIQRGRKIERFFDGPNDRNPRSDVSYLVEVFKLSAGTLKMPDEHFAGYSLTRFYKREVIKEFDVGFGQVNANLPDSGSAWPYEQKILYKSVQNWAPERTAYDNVKFTFSRKWSIAVSFDQTGAYSVKSPEFGFDAPRVLPSDGPK